MSSFTNRKIKIVSNEDSSIAENPIARDSYYDEKQIFSIVRNGDTEALKTKLDDLFSSDSKFQIGKMSVDSLRQTQYSAVAFITLITRIAIEAGIPEQEAYTQSDEFIRQIDIMKKNEDIYNYIINTLLNVTEKIHIIKSYGDFSPIVKKTIEYIDTHIFEKITLEQLAEEKNVSESYLSRLFKSEIEISVTEYIRKKKIEKSCELIDTSDLSLSEISSHLAFCSQSYFIKCFKLETGMTPAEYKHTKAHIE